MLSYRDFAAAPVAHSIMFHHFHGSGHPQVQGSIDARQLGEILDFVKKSHHVIDSQLWIEKALEARLEPDDVCLSFDDSLLSQYEIAVPVLRELGHTGLFFVYSSVFEGGFESLEIYRTFRTVHFRSVDDFYQEFFGCLEKSDHKDVYKTQIGAFNGESYLADFPFYSVEDKRFRFVRDKILGPTAYGEVMDWMIRERGLTYEVLARRLWMDQDHLVSLTAAGHVIGLHSYTHPTAIAGFPEAQQLEEYRANVEHLSDQFGVSPIVMAHPSNSYSESTLRILTGLGVRIGFRGNMARPHRSGLEYPREDHANILRMMRRVTV